MNAPESPKKNRRLSPRRPPKRSLRVSCIKGSLGLGANVGVAVLDVSETGIRLVVSSALEAGNEVEIELSSTVLPRPVKILAHVVWCVAAADGNHCIGAHFQKRMNYAYLMQLT